MVNIINIPREHGHNFEIDARIINPEWRTSIQGDRYLYCHLADSSDAIPAYFWSHNAELEELLIHGRMVNVSGYGKQLNFQFHLTIDNIVESDNLGASIATLPACICPRPEGLKELKQHIDVVDVPALKSFIYALFSDPKIAISYLSVPASREHHHAYVGGMLDHCNEVARYCRNQSDSMSLLELSLIITAALTHDIGKIRTHGSTLRHSWIVNHDCQTLEVLAGPLKQLDMDWPDGGLALRYLLTRKQAPNRNSLSLMPIAEILESGDRFSAAKNVEETVFFKSYPGASYAKWAGPGPVNRFWRPSELSEPNLQNQERLS